MTDLLTKEQRREAAQAHLTEAVDYIRDAFGLQLECVITARNITPGFVQSEALLVFNEVPNWIPPAGNIPPLTD